MVHIRTMENGGGGLADNRPVGHVGKRIHCLLYLVFVVLKMMTEGQKSSQHLIAILFRRVERIYQKDMVVPLACRITRAENNGSLLSDTS